MSRVQGSGHSRHESVFMACCCSGQTVDNVRPVREVELTSRVEQVLPPALSRPILPPAGTSGVAPSLAPRCFMESSQGTFLVLGISVVGLEVWWGPWGAWGQNVSSSGHTTAWTFNSSRGLMPDAHLALFVLRHRDKPVRDLHCASRNWPCLRPLNLILT